MLPILVIAYVAAGVWYADDYLTFATGDQPPQFFGHLLVAALIVALWPIVLIGRFLALTR